MKLPRLQLHLSTCIVLMFVAGGLVWANALKVYDLKTLDISSFTQGWPLPYFKIDYPAEDYYYPQNLAVNLATALAILAAVAFVCEWSIRRRKLDHT
jgi:hypothetical protein